MKFFKVAALPGVLVPDAFYFVENAGFAEGYLTGSDGSAHSIGNTAMIQAVANPLIAAAVAQLGTIDLTATIATRNALPDPGHNRLVLVSDATGDPTVGAGAATYFWDTVANTWTKIAEYEAMDVTLAWANIANRPASTVAQIDDAVAKRHTHANLAQLDKIGEAAGAMTYNGQEVGGTWATTAW